jgi:hypothetical protein
VFKQISVKLRAPNFLNPKTAKGSRQIAARKGAEGKRKKENGVSFHASFLGVKFSKSVFCFERLKSFFKVQKLKMEIYGLKGSVRCGKFGRLKDSVRCGKFSQFNNENATFHFRII